MAQLTAKKRAGLKGSDFAIDGQQRRYPIDTPARARNAITRVRQFGTAAEQARVIAAVKRRYPGIDVEAKAGKGPTVGKDKPATVRARQQRARRERGVRRAGEGALVAPPPPAPPFEGKSAFDVLDELLK